MHDGTLSALNLDLQDNPIGARLEFGRPEPAGSLYKVPMRIRVPLPSLVLVPGSGVWHGKMRIWFAAKDENDELSEVQTIDVPLDIPADEWDELKDKDYLLPINLDMEAGNHNIAVGIRDTMGARSSFIRRQVLVGG